MSYIDHMITIPINFTNALWLYHHAYLGKHISTLPKNNLRNVSLKLTDFLNSWKCFLYWSPLEKGCGPYLIKLEFPLLGNSLCQVWFILAPSSKIVVSVFFIFCYYLPLNKSMIFALSEIKRVVNVCVLLR